jgi:hypothetical protein
MLTSYSVPHRLILLPFTSAAAHYACYILRRKRQVATRCGQLPHLEQTARDGEITFRVDRTILRRSPSVLRIGTYRLGRGDGFPPYHAADHEVRWLTNG